MSGPTGPSGFWKDLLRHPVPNGVLWVGMTDPLSANITFLSENPRRSIYIGRLEFKKDGTLAAPASISSLESQELVKCFDWPAFLDAVRDAFQASQVMQT